MYTSPPKRARYGGKRYQLTDAQRKTQSYMSTYRRPLPPLLRGRFSGGSSELKFFDTALSFNLDATGEVPATGQLVLIPQGVTESTRVGRKCVVKSIQIRANLTFQPGAAASAATNAYIYLVQDTQTNGAAAGATDVLTSTNFASALRNMSNIERFKIYKLFSWSFVSTAGVTTAYNDVRKQWTYFKRCNIPLEYSATDGSLGTIRSNNLFLLAGTDGGSDDTVIVGGTCRVRFSDGS